MRQQFLTIAELLPSKGHKEYTSEEIIAAAEKAAPWAAQLVDVEGGVHAFESAADYRRWAGMI